MPSSSSPKKWTVNTSSGEPVTIEAERAEIDGSRVRVTFYNSDGDAVGSFAGFTSFYLTPSQ